MKTIQIELENQLEKALTFYCRENGISHNDVIVAAVEKMLSPYISDVEPIPAILTETGEKCFILGETTIYDQPYYKIVKKGQILSAPKAAILIASKNTTAEMKKEQSMNDYKVTITETLSRTVTVSAETEYEATDKVRDMLSIGQIVLVAEDFTEREIEAKLA